MHPSYAQYPGVARHGPCESAPRAITIAPFMLAATLIQGMPRMAHFKYRHLLPALHQLAQRVRVQPSAWVAPWTCELALTISANRVHRQSLQPYHPLKVAWEQALAAQDAQECPTSQALDRFERRVASPAHIAAAGLGQVVYIPNRQQSETA